VEAVASYRYERLSAQDNGFLQWETPNLPMHGGATQIYDAGPLATPDGGVDFETIRRGIESILHLIPRYRQKILWAPGEDHAVWIDDPHFNLAYHMRHTSLPRPGNDRQLKALAARIMERPLDRARPLWEMWIVEGLEGGRFALISKTHHCMVDGMGGVDLATTLMSPTPEFEIAEPPRYLPRPVPTRAELRRDRRARQLGLPVRATRELVDFLRSSDDPREEVATRLRALAGMARWKLVPASETPFNGPVGPHRVLDWVSLPLADVKAVRKALGCSVNDVVLATVTGAVREFLLRRASLPDGLDFRVSTPVSVRSDSERGRLGNRVSSWVVPLPVATDDPRAQVEEIHRITQELKASHQAAAIEMIEAFHEWVPLDMQALSRGTHNMFVTNVPGPQFPLYLLGAKMVDIFVHAPLIEDLGLVVGAMSYNGRVCWGFVADYDRVPDVADFAALVPRCFERLAEAAGVRVASARPHDVAGDAPDQP
jgi:WS/DGAT/MGAT family acyltransferase